MTKIDNDEPMLFDVEADLDPPTALGQEFMRQFRAAIAHRKTLRVGDKGLDEVLRDCFAARDDRTLCDEQALRDKYPPWAAMPVSIVAFKVNILVAMVRESLVDVADAPFIIDPTPVPEIPEEERDRVINELLADVTAGAVETAAMQAGFQSVAAENGVSTDVAETLPEYPRLDPQKLVELMRQRKGELFQKVKQHAEEQAQLLQRDLYDKTTEGGYKRAVMEFADDFATYPFACIHAPFPVKRVDTAWKKGRFVEEEKVVWAFERVSPFDLFWTEDSTTTQDGTAVFIRKRVSYDYLFDARRAARDDTKSGYQRDELEELLSLIEDGRIPRNWVDFTATNPETARPVFGWARGTTTDILIRYGRTTGYDLEGMGVKVDDLDRLYETKVIMCGGRVIQCLLNGNPGKYKRPVFTASFEARNGSIVGVGLGQKLLSLHNAYRAVINLMLYNLGLASEPITEVEVNRILQYMPEDWVDEPSVAPGMVIPADGDRMGNGSRAIKFTQIPTTTGEALRLASYIFEQAHVISNIPAALHGQPVGSGANRTVRGLLTLQGNTLKPVHSALLNLDLGVIEPMITLLYMLLVMYDKDFDYTGDCKVVAKGAASMIQREMDKQTAMENLQILGQFGEQVNPVLMERSVRKLLSTAGILEPGEEALLTTQAPAQPGGLPSQQGIPGQAPSQAPGAAEAAPPQS
uniref:Head to tail connecting protein n=1 Tax=Podoviridae sp. ctlpi2 TaxID=2826574 RepID=A0A8S5MLG9_9CAUD|nr:MAG TPA: head to tail connecting protein [Podoviridae sp. ctlpi2]